VVQEGKPWKRESHYLALDIEAEVEEAAEISSSTSIIVKFPIIKIQFGSSVVPHLWIWGQLIQSHSYI